MSKKIVISGCPRSGTSITSLMVKEALGEDRFISARKRPIRKLEPPTDPVDKYLYKRQERLKANSKIKDRIERVRDMNPTGFHEMEWSVNGIQYSIARHTELLDGDAPRKALKIVSQGLVATDPQYIDRVIMCIRNPRSVAKSQERLEGQFGKLPKPQVDGAEYSKHDPDMFIRVSIMAAHWFTVNSEVPCLIVDFDDIHDDTAAVVARMAEFIGEGSWDNVPALVDKKLKRSMPKDIPHPHWEYADAIYEKLKLADWQGVLDIGKRLNEYRMETRSKLDPIMCTRLNAQVSLLRCNLCRTRDAQKNRMIAENNARRRVWYNEPCLRDVAEGKCTVEESIANHTWKK